MTHWKFDEITRREHIAVKLSVSVTKKNRSYVAKKLKALNLFTNLFAEDIVDVAYVFNIDYLNSIEDRLSALIALLSKKDVVVQSASIHAINKSKSIIIEILRKIDKLNNTLEKRGIR